MVFEFMWLIVIETDESLRLVITQTIVTPSPLALVSIRSVARRPVNFGSSVQDKAEIAAKLDIQLRCCMAILRETGNI
jgi:hypothetical protein